MTRHTPAARALALDLDPRDLTALAAAGFDIDPLDLEAAALGLDPRDATAWADLDALEFAWRDLDSVQMERALCALDGDCPDARAQGIAWA